AEISSDFFSDWGSLGRNLFTIKISIPHTIPIALRIIIIKLALITTLNF
ncbi:unnamed protein product, partial [marine sediment metagenome]